MADTNRISEIVVNIEHRDSYLRMNITESGVNIEHRDSYLRMNMSLIGVMVEKSPLKTPTANQLINSQII